MKKIILYLCVLLLSVTAQASSADDLFAEGNQAFEAKAYEKAIQAYEGVLAMNKESAELYFNLGNAYYRNNNLGKSILNYERAKRYAPHFEDNNYNLSIAQNKTIDNITPVPPFFLAVLWQGIYQLMSPSIWGILGVLMLLASVGGVAYWLLSAERVRKQQGFYGAIAGLLCAILFLAAGNSYHQYQNNKQTAILMQQVDFKDGADELSNTISALHEGLKVYLIESINDWQKVQLENGEVGWLPVGSFEKI